MFKKTYFAVKKKKNSPAIKLKLLAIYYVNSKTVEWDIM